MLRGSVTASLIGYVLLMHVKEFGQLLIGISSLLVKISRGLYYERMKFIPLYSRVDHEVGHRVLSGCCGLMIFSGVTALYLD